MKYKVFTVLVFFLAGIAVHAQSLGDLGREEQKRRESISEAKTITFKVARSDEPEESDDERSSAEAEKTQNIDAVKEEDNEEENENSGDESDSNEARDFYGNTESYWRSTMVDARDRIKQLEDEAKELTYLRNDLQSQRSRKNTLLRGPLNEELDQTRQAQELNRKNLEQARQEIQSLQNIARSSGAFPGWIE